MILWRAGMRNVLRHPWLTVLAVLGVALGVAVVTAVDHANEAAQRAFRLAAETVAGRATHQVVGGPTGLPDGLYRTIRVGLRFRGCAPVVTGHLQLSGRTFQLIGIDPFSEPPIRTFSSHFADRGMLTDLMTRPGSVLMLAESAAERGLKRGAAFPADGAGVRRQLTLAGFLEPPDEVSRAALASVLVCDISTAQELLGMVGRLSRIDLVLPEGEEGARVLKELRPVLPPGADIVPAGARAGALDKMTRAFRLNLKALSLLALVVGMFLIYNTMTFSVVRRRRLIGMLRALGVSRREVFTMICGEALVIGIAGTVAGLAAGALLGAELTRLVTRTINDLYFVMEVRRVPLLPGALWKGALLGVAATLAATVPAALESTGAPPRAVLSRSQVETRRRRLVPLAAAGGLLLMLVGCGFFFTERGGIVGGFVGLFAVIVGYTLMVPAAVLLLSALLRFPLELILGSLGRMAARGVVVSLSRTGVATAALVVAVSAGIGVGIMVGGFRLTVQNWLGNWLQADVYLTSADRGGGRYRPPLDPALVRRLSALQGEAQVTLSRRVRIEGAAGGTEVFSVQVPERTFLRYPFKEGDPALAWRRFNSGEAVLVSEPYSYRHHLRPGDSVTLRTSRGDRRFPVAGIIYDYGSDTGIVIMSRAGYVGNFGDESVDGMSFTARSGLSVARLLELVRATAGGEQVMVVSNAQLRRATVEVFDRTFAITGVLRMLTMLVAFVGILSALMAMQVERARELAVLRAVGLTPGQVWGVVCGETVLIGLIAGVLSLPLGIVEALVLIYVVNLRSFGWTMQLAIPPAQLVQAVVLSVTAALLAGIYPSLRIARTSPALALKEEE
ncbi:FtsX-like permease family protein [Geomonas oryzisoli]|uniref:FtsX-like permease family protein n=1 Tax=Geomonas oryzisoli TaxID=2847992 RepID=A0ABX8JEA7_9BACT|nr:FtsX-like permease family protein [Geomonas oryzisoli]QWV95471.1 FtsX-like permease family protein [Geomonas oryzisoli]